MQNTHCIYCENRCDLADFIVKQISSDKYIHQKVAIAY